MSKARNTTSYAGTYAEILADRMRQLNVSSRKLEELSTYSYEHIRKVLKDGAIHSREANMAFCRALDLDEGAMWEVAQREKLQKRYGDAMPSSIMAPHDPFVRSAWSELTNDQRNSIKKIVQGFIEQNRIARESLVSDRKERKVS